MSRKKTLKEMEDHDGILEKVLIDTTFYCPAGLSPNRMFYTR